MNRVRDFSGAISDRLVVDGGDLVRRFGGALAWPFRRTAWALQDRLIWPILDRVSGRAVVAFGVVAVAAGAGAAGLLLPSNGAKVSARTEAAATESPIAKVASPAPKASPQPTLHGATPVFEPGRKGRSAAAGSAKRVVPSPGEATGTASSSGAASSSAATDTISPAPAARASAVPAGPAGPEAIAVAHEFANAFVVYETGGVEPTVRKVFGKTATPRLSRALLRRPPRLPADVEVPKAKVMNVVAAPSRGPAYPVSVSLLRLGITSELRLSMERKKNDDWRVADVLG